MEDRVFWVPDSVADVWHVYPDCQALQGVHRINIGTQADATAGGKSHLCTYCQKRLDRAEPIPDSTPTSIIPPPGEIPLPPEFQKYTKLGGWLLVLCIWLICISIMSLGQSVALTGTMNSIAIIEAAYSIFLVILVVAHSSTFRIFYTIGAASEILLGFFLAFDLSSSDSTPYVLGPILRCLIGLVYVYSSTRVKIYFGYAFPPSSTRTSGSVSTASASHTTAEPPTSSQSSTPAPTSQGPSATPSNVQKMYTFSKTQLIVIGTVVAVILVFAITGIHAVLSDSYDSGFADGHAVGYDNGYADGEDDGYNQGDSQGYASGYSMGYADGYDAGYPVGLEDGFRSGTYYAGYSDLYLDANNAANEIVYVTSTGSKYHKFGCSFLRYGYSLMYRVDAILQGYTDCSLCNFS